MRSADRLWLAIQSFGPSHALKGLGEQVAQGEMDENVKRMGMDIHRDRDRDCHRVFDSIDKITRRGR